jgi:2-dehydro-3-deoxygluconokinase
MAKVLTFGEMMLRLHPSGYQRIIQANQFDANYGGAEANVAVSLSLLGDESEYLTKLPNNPLGTAALSELQKYGVNTKNILYGGPRLGIYYFEKGASIRSTNVVYDRAGSSFAMATKSDFSWPKILKSTNYFYFSGITPAISTEIEESVFSACQYCQKNGIKVICDLNYRGKMWTTHHAQCVMSKLMNYVDVCIANDEDFEASLGIKAFDGNMKFGIDQKDNFKKGMYEITKRYPNCHIVASILRNIESVETSQWTGLLLKDGHYYQSPIYDMHVMEGVASGDAFGAGLVHGILHHFEPKNMINYAIAASVLKLTINGDFNLISDPEIRSIQDHGTGASMSR